MKPALQYRSNELSTLCRRHHVRRLSVFGSAARDEMRTDSDVDLLIEFEAGQSPSLAGLARLKHGAEHARLKCGDRRVIAAGELSERQVGAIRNARVPDQYADLDEEI